MITTYNFRQSIDVLKRRLRTKVNTQRFPAIPSCEESGNEGTIAVYGTAVSIRYGYLEGEKTDEDAKMKAIECFVAGTCEILRAANNCRDVIITDSLITAIYSTPLKDDMDALIDDMARINSLSAIVSKLLGQSIGKVWVKQCACYDTMTMSVVETIGDYKRFLWCGNAVDRAHRLSEECDERSIFISKIIWNNLTVNNRKLFELSDTFDEIYNGRFANIAMNNWLDEK